MYAIKKENFKFGIYQTWKNRWDLKKIWIFYPTQVVYYDVEKSKALPTCSLNYKSNLHQIIKRRDIIKKSFQTNQKKRKKLYCNKKKGYVIAKNFGLKK